MNNKTQQNNKGFADFVAGYMELLTKHGVLPEGDGIDFEGVDSAKTATVDLLGFLDSICELNDEPGPVGNLADLADEDGVLSFTHEQKQALTNEVTGAFNKTQAGDELLGLRLKIGAFFSGV